MIKNKVYADEKLSIEYQLTKIGLALQTILDIMVAHLV